LRKRSPTQYKPISNGFYHVAEIEECSKSFILSSYFFEKPLDLEGKIYSSDQRQIVRTLTALSQIRSRLGNYEKSMKYSERYSGVQQ
jgi:hypothetical protein